jgi:hypothetical protein
MTRASFEPHARSPAVTSARLRHGGQLAEGLDAGRGTSFRALAGSLAAFINRPAAGHATTTLPCRLATGVITFLGIDHCQALLRAGP